MAGTPSRTLVLTLTAVTDKFRKGLGDAEGKLGGFGEKMANFGKKAALAFAAVGAAAGALAVKIGKDAILAASDLNEEISKSGELFGDSASKIEEWSKTSATAFGQSRRQATAAAGTFAIFGRAAGLTGDELVDFSTGFTELASDLASFNNTSPEDAINAIGSALRGEALPLRRYGILLDDATLRQKAFELGLISTTKQALTPQQKVLAAQKLIYEQAGAAAGDFARTSDGLANSQRILAANLEDVKATLGEALLPIAERFTSWLIGILPDVITFAKELGEKMAPAIEKVGDFIATKLLPFAADVWPHIRDFAIWVKDLVVQFAAFVREDIAPRALQLIRDLTEPAKEAWLAIKDMSAAIRDARDAWSSANPQGSAFLDLLFKLEKFKWEWIIGKIEALARAIEWIARALEAWGKAGKGARDLIATPGDLGLGDFTPGEILPSARTVLNSSTRPSSGGVTVNFYGPTDSESAAREIRKVIADSSRRTSYGPALAF